MQLERDDKNLVDKSETFKKLEDKVELTSSTKFVWI